VDLSNLGTDIALKQLQDKGPLPKADPVAQAPGEVLNSFGQILKDHINDVNTLQSEASKATQTYAVGGPVELHQVMIAAEKAETALQLTMQIRNKVLAAYQEVSHMSI
jgi:flagellar hook-basal body complex protein FliE